MVLAMVSNCVICGRFFRKVTNKITCSNECAVKLKKNKDREYKKNPVNRERKANNQRRRMENQVYRSIQNKYKREWSNKPVNIEKRRERTQNAEYRDWYRKYWQKWINTPGNREKDRNRRKTASYMEWEKKYRKRAPVIEKRREYHRNKYRYDTIFREQSKKRHQEWHSNKMKDPSYRERLIKYGREYRGNPLNREASTEYSKRASVIERRKKRYRQKMETQSLAVTMAALTQPKTNKE